MNLDVVIGQLQAHCPTFQGRIAGAARFKMLDEASSMPLPVAYVIPLDDNPGTRMSLNDVRQPIIESFAVIVALDNTVDERGQSSANAAHSTIRAELWAALLGWQPDGLRDKSRYRGIEYQGANLLNLDRARLWYQFDFGAYMEITPSDGWQQPELAAYPHFDNVYITVNNDPDGAPNFVEKIPKTGTFP
jgi:hypothetical protein